MGARSTTFTSYVNIEEAKGVDASLSALERKANATMARIAQQAQKTSATTSGVRAGPNVSQLNSLAGAERQHAAALQRTASASNAAAAASAHLAGKHLLESNAARAASNSTSALERSLRLASVAANVAQGPLGPLAGRLSAIATAVRELTGIPLGLVGAGALGATFIRAASSAQELKSKLFPLFDSQTQVNSAFKETIRIANDARLSLEPVIDLYSRLTLGGRDVGLSQQRIMSLTETAAKAAKLSGGSQQSQDAGLYQFAQGIGSGNLGGDELKSVRENTIRLAKAIADGLGVTIADLKKMGAEGKLTATVIADALESQRSRIDAELAKLPPTIASSTAKLQNAFTAMVNGGDEAYGVTVTLAAGLQLLADNLGIVTRLVVGLAIAYAAVRAVDMARTTLANANAWRVEQAEIAKTARTAAEAANARRRTSAQSIVDLRAERTALQSRLEAERALAAETRQTAIAANKKFSSPDYIGKPSDFAAYRVAVEQATMANDNFNASKSRLKNITGQLREETQHLSQQTTVYREAAENARKSSNLFASAGKALWGIIGPNLLGMALGVGINLLIEFATREDAAAVAADHMATAQSQLARFIDFTTGKIREQNTALIQNELLTLRGQRKTAVANYRNEKNTLNSQLDDQILTSEGYAVVLETDPRIKQIGNRYRAGELNAAGVSRELAALKEKNPALSNAIDPILQQSARVVATAQEAETYRAGENILSGKGSKEDFRRAQGNFSGQDIDFSMGGPAGKADEKLKKAREGRAGATNAATKAERELQQAQDRSDKRTDILARYDAQPTALDRARKDARELQQMVGKEVVDQRFVSEKNTLGKGIYSQEMADADRNRIEYGVRQPIRDAIDEQQRGIEISRLRLEGYDLEANALEKALSVQKNMGEVSREELAILIENERTQARINDALDSRQRQMAGILDAANQTRDAFEDMLVGLARNPLDAIKNFGSTIVDNIMRIEARKITESLFAGSDEKLRDLISGSNGVDRANEILANSVQTTADTLPPLGTAATNTATALEAATARINAVANGITTGGVAGLAPAIGSTASAAGSLESQFDAAFGAGKGGSLASIVKTAAALSTTTAGLSALPGMYAAAKSIPAAANENVDTNTIVVDAPRRAPAPEQQGPVPSGTQAYESVFATLGEKLDKTFKSGTFFKGIGKGVGQAFGGAASGMMASGLLGAVGVKQSQTGAAIGGALGNVLLPGIGGIVGGLLGGTIGALFQKTKTGSASLGANQFGYAGVTGTGGNDAETKKVVSGLAGSVADQLNQIADAFGGNIGSFSVAIGKRKDEYRVSGSGNEGSTTGKKANGNDIIYKGKDEQAAIAAAVQNAIEDGAIAGISAAAQNILKSGQNLQTAITKALAIESIPKRLMQKTDPVRYAVTQLNEEFSKLIAYLKEGGATAAQFADAQKLYELERADAIKQATQQSIAALQAYLDEMQGGASSPFNKKTVYENAAAKLASFRGDIAAGKVVDQNELLAAAKNFQDASQKLYGSSAAFFTDFNDLFQLLTKARDNAAGTGSATLPDSPFATADMSTYLSQLNQTTANQTDILAGKLDSILSALQGGTASAGDVKAWALNLLPGVNMAA